MNEEVDVTDLEQEVVDEMAEVLRDLFNDDNNIDRILERCNYAPTQENVNRVKKTILHGLQTVRDLV